MSTLPATGRRLPVWALGLVPLLLVGALVAALVAGGVPGLGERNGAPVERVAVERTTLRPGEISLLVRNDGPDPVTVAQVTVNDAFIPAAQLPPELGRLASGEVRIPYDWLEGEAYEVGLLTSSGLGVAVPIEAAAETPAADAGFFGLLGLLGVYVGVIPVAVGMLWLPFARRAGGGVLRFLMAVTVGLLAFLAVDATLEGLEVAGAGPQAFGGAGLVWLGAIAAYLALSAVDAWVGTRRAGLSGMRLAALVALGIGLHNLGEGLAIGSAYAVGELALGAFLVVGFALHNTTEGLAVVAPVAKERPGAAKLVGLGLLAGAPAVLGAWIGGAAYSPSIAALLLGVGAGAIARVCVQLLPSLRGDGARAVTPLTAGGLGAGLAVMYLTSLLVSA